MLHFPVPFLLLCFCARFSLFLFGTVWDDVSFLAAIITGCVGVAVRVDGCIGFFGVVRLLVSVAMWISGTAAIAIPSLARSHISLGYPHTSCLATYLFVNGKNFFSMSSSVYAVPFQIEQLNCSVVFRIF
jgi:hypothetical protein